MSGDFAKHFTLAMGFEDFYNRPELRKPIPVCILQTDKLDLSRHNGLTTRHSFGCHLPNHPDQVRLEYLQVDNNKLYDSLNIKGVAKQFEFIIAEHIICCCEVANGPITYCGGLTPDMCKTFFTDICSLLTVNNRSIAMLTGNCFTEEDPNYHRNVATYRKARRLIKQILIDLAAKIPEWQFWWFEMQDAGPNLDCGSHAVVITRAETVYDFIDAERLE